MDMAGLGAIVKFKPEISFNTNRYAKNGKKLPDGIEIRFGKNRPTEAVRELLKAQGFQWSEKQKMWYAYQTEASKKFADDFAAKEIEVDDTQYEKLHFWAKVRNMAEYKKLSSFTTFKVGSAFYNSKNQLEKATAYQSLIGNGELYFKKFYNKAIDNEGIEPQNLEPAQAGQSQEPLSRQPSVSLQKQIAEKFRTMADAMQKTIDSKINSATSKQRPTARRNRVASGMRQEGYRLQEIQQALYALAYGYETSAPSLHSGIIEHIRSKEDVRRVLFYSLRESPWHGYNSFNREEWSNFCEKELQANKDEYHRLGMESVYDMSRASVQMGELIKAYRSEKGNFKQAAPSFDPKQAKIKELENNLFGRKIPGFFPTPNDLARRVVELAQLEAHHSVLEPSAGKGDLAEAIQNECSSCHLDCIEINPQLREILELKGFTLLEERDFLVLNPKEKYDRIIMNPPFEDGQDIDHVLHAYELLKPGGKVVAIMSEGPFFRQYKKDVSFREFLEKNNAYVSEPIQDAFKNAFNSTGVNVRIISLQKPATNTISVTDNEREEIELLELEAAAEIEILKMRVELARKSKGASKESTINGISTTKRKGLIDLATSLESSLSNL